MLSYWISLCKKVTKSKTSWQRDASQLKFICSMPTLEALEKGVKVFKVNNENTRTTCSNVFVVNF